MLYNQEEERKNQVPWERILINTSCWRDKIHGYNVYSILLHIEDGIEGPYKKNVSTCDSSSDPELYRL